MSVQTNILGQPFMMSVDAPDTLDVDVLTLTDPNTGTVVYGPTAGTVDSAQQMHWLLTGLGAGLYNASAAMTVSGVGPQTATFQINIVTTGSATSRSYRTFADTDTDTGKILNDNKPMVMRQSECAHGLGWKVPEGWSGASVTVTATGADNDAEQPAALTGLTGFVDPADDHHICLDFPPDLVKPCGDWIFYATLALAGDTDITSGILVRIQPDLT